MLWELVEIVLEAWWHVDVDELSRVSGIGGLVHAPLGVQDFAFDAVGVGSSLNHLNKVLTICGDLCYYKKFLASISFDQIDQI